jgi:methylglutaconyl-CoA hydratase
MADLKRVLWEGTNHWETLLYERAAISGRLVLTPKAQKCLADLAATVTSGTVPAARRD